MGPDEIDSVDVTLGETQAAILRNHRPQTGLEAKFSEGFAMAAAAIAGQAGLGELTDDFVQRDDVQKFMEKVAISSTINIR